MKYTNDKDLYFVGCKLYYPDDLENVRTMFELSGQR
jgi:hypothetical protein